MEQHGQDLEQVRDELAVLSRERAQVLEQQEATVKEAESVKKTYAMIGRRPRSS